MRRLALAGVLCVTAACGGSSDGPTSPSPQVPSIGGVYSSSSFWQIRLVRTADGATANLNCIGTMSVTQSGSAFSGSFTQGAPCDTLSGNITQGAIRSDGGVSFGITVPGADPNAFNALTGCVATAAGSQFNGIVSNRTMDASVSMVLNCPDEGQVTLTLRALGTR